MEGPKMLPWLWLEVRPLGGGVVDLADVDPSGTGRVWDEGAVVVALLVAAVILAEL